MADHPRTGRTSTALLAALAAVFIPLAASCTTHPKLSFQQSASKPSTVVAVTTSAGDAQVVVRWAEPPSSEDVTSFRVYSADEYFSTWSSALPGAVVSTAGACCSFLRSGLSNDQPYWFAVSAVNLAGEGPMSQAVEGIPPGWAGTQVWGTAKTDVGWSIALDAQGNLYVAGSTTGDLGPEGNAGGEDAVLLKYDERGDLVWVHQWGTTGDDLFNGVTVTPGGTVFATGTESITTSAAEVLLRFAPSGSLAWVKSVPSNSGTAIAHSSDGQLYVAASSYTSYGNFETQASNVAGYCGDAVVGDLDTAGTLLWGEEIGSGGVCTNGAATELPQAVSVDSNGVTIAGETNGTFAGQTASGGFDFFVARFRRSDGAYLWVRQLGSPSNESFLGLAADAAGNVYAVGYTNGTLPSKTSLGGTDAVVASWDASGNPRWVTQFGTAGSDVATSVVATPSGLLIAGESNSGPIGSVSADVFVSRFDAATGNMIGATQIIDPSGDEEPLGMAVNPAGAVFLTGSKRTYVQTTTDGFLQKLDPQLEPL